jgi:LCP family protein required for cell wall assembly
MDVDAIPPGTDFAQVISAALADSTIFLAIIGPSWLTCTNQSGKRRLDDPTDFVRMETAAALRRGIVTIPLLVHEAKMPRRRDLPEALGAIADRQRFELADHRWRTDVQTLIRNIEKLSRSKPNTSAHSTRSGLPALSTGFGRQDPAPPDRVDTAPVGGHRPSAPVPRPVDAPRLHQEVPQLRHRELVAARTGDSPPRVTGAPVQPGFDQIPRGQRTPAPKKRIPSSVRTTRSPIRLIAAALSLTVFITIGSAWNRTVAIEMSFQQVEALEPMSGAVVDPGSQTGAQNLLLLASDRARPSTERADTIVLLHIPKDEIPPVAISMPRDLEVNRPACDDWDSLSGSPRPGRVPGEADTTLISVWEVGGPKCVVEVVQQLTGLAVTQYVGFNLDATRGLAVALSGVEVCDQHRTLLDGDRADEFVRAQSGREQSSTATRQIEQQQQFLTAALEQSLATALPTVPGNVNAVQTALRGALMVDGDSLSGVLAGTRLLRHLGSTDIAYTAIPSASASDGSGTVLLDTQAAAMFSAIREHGQLPTRSSADLTSAPTPGDLRVHVLNASGLTGRGEQVAGTLGSFGYGIDAVEDADRKISSTIIKFSPDQASAAAVLASAVPSATAVPDPGSSGVLELVLGTSFDDVLQPSRLTASAVEAGTPASTDCA